MYRTLAKLAISTLNPKGKLIADRLRRHFGWKVSTYPVVRATFPRFRHPCVAVAINTYLKQGYKRSKFVGTATYDSDLSLSDLLHPDRSRMQFEGTPQFREVALSNGKSMSYAAQGLYLVKEDFTKSVIFINHGGRFDEEVALEVMAKDRAVAKKIISEIRALADKHSIYRDKILSMHMKGHEGPFAKFHTVPRIAREQLILPETTLELLDRHTIAFSAHREILKARGQHLKRGLLLYGPPGTGKTLSIMYIISAMPGRTTILINGASIEHLEDACDLARSLEPATIVIDDVDLVAEERSRHSQNKVLFELLNQMDGMTADADILFLLGTNKPENLEPALASRPGRIDQAINIALPDKDCRLRLFASCGQKLPIQLSDPERLADETDGASGAFIRELYRKAVLLAADEGADVVIEDRHLFSALETLRSGGELMEKLLAFKVTPLGVEAEVV